MLEYTVVRPVELGGKKVGYLLRCDNGAEIVWKNNELKKALRAKIIKVNGLKVDTLGRLVLCK